MSWIESKFKNDRDVQAIKGLFATCKRILSLIANLDKRITALERRLDAVGDEIEPVLADAESVDPHGS